MDSSDEDSDISYEFEDADESEELLLSLSLGMPLTEIHRAVVEEDLNRVRCCIEKGESVNQQEPNYNYSALHLAVLYNNLELLNYLLSNKDVEVDARCSNGKTPLYLAAKHGQIESVEKLIQAGSDVNIADNNNDTALHMSAKFPPIAQLLMRHGARIRTDDSQKRTLHTAARSGCLELVHMLLYYNVDANVPDRYGCTAFMVALVCGNEEAQELLLEYVDDFNRFYYRDMRFISTLGFALQSSSPFVKDIIERGADVDSSNYVEGPIIEYSFLADLNRDRPIDVLTFKMLWEKLRCNDFYYPIHIFCYWNCLSDMQKFLPIVIESDNFEPAIPLFTGAGMYLSIVEASVGQNFDLGQLTAFTCRLLEYGFRPSSYDLYEIFFNYGYCELFRILLYMDTDFFRGWEPYMALCRLIFDIDYNLEDIGYQLDEISKKILLQLLEYSICPYLSDSLNSLAVRYSDDESLRAILCNLPKLPSLTELARTAARKYIWRAFKVTNNCQFYTIIKHLDIPTVYRDILTFKRKIYMIK